MLGKHLDTFLTSAQSPVMGAYFLRPLMNLEAVS